MPTGQLLPEGFHGPGAGIPSFAQGVFRSSKDVISVLQTGMALAYAFREWSAVCH